MFDEDGAVYSNETHSFNHAPSNHWYDPTIGTLSAVRILAVHIINYGGYVSFIMASSYGGCITDNPNWRCTTSLYPQWYVYCYYVTIS